jgi:hypothetical protein
VKRRAYDALTVLVACGVIEKQGKEIKINAKCHLTIRTFLFLFSLKVYHIH